ncbi:hypothetical protein PFLA_a1874 [Pseudoalteromonas flavipulchra NCIMB 2033 = ATCC BAA-314]|nr:hypothetical protein [Pseudoalteromonas flavipulchra NCIMB 2033 = ATCC BAA-314]
MVLAGKFAASGDKTRINKQSYFPHIQENAQVAHFYLSQKIVT